MIEFRESKVAEMDRRHHHHRRRRRATDDARPICNETNATFDEDTKFIANRINVLKIFHGSNISRVRESLERLPIKLTLENVGIFALSLASIMPRTFTHLLVYPIFRLVFGTLYPAYASYKAVRTKNVKEYVKWMMYWIVFALFTCAETFTDVFLSFWFPFYYEIKIILVLWLLSPATKGSSILYRRFVHPALSRREAEIDEALARATEQGYTAVLHLGSRGVNYATTVLMQTAIKGGGGLVQQLKKSYSLSDLTGEKEDENRNTPDTRDEIDMQVEPRRRENVGRRGYSPRRTQSGSNRVDMYFSEVDVDVRQPKPREPIASLSNIRSSDDVSSGYSSGEALHPGRVGSQAEPLVRTASVGARTRPKPRSTAKKTPEDVGAGEEADDLIELPVCPRIPLPISKNFISSEQAVELLIALFRNGRFAGIENASVVDFPTKFERAFKTEGDNPVEKKSPSRNDEEHSSRDSSPEFLDSVSDPRVVAGVEELPKKNPEIEIDGPAKNSDSIVKNRRNSSSPSLKRETHAHPAPAEILTDEICQSRFDELKNLISGARKAISSAMSTENANVEEIKDGSKNRTSNASHLRPPESPSRFVSRSNSDCSTSGDRAGKYNKKPAPKVPITKSEENFDDPTLSGSRALRATLVIKTGRVKTVTNVESSREIFTGSDPPIDSSGKTTKRKSRSRTKAALRTREGFSKLLTIPKTIFNTAFNQREDELGVSDGSKSRSVSLSSREFDPETTGTSSSGWNEEVDRQMDVETALIKAAALDSNADTYIDLRSSSIDNYVSEDSKSEDLEKTVYDIDEYKERAKNIEEAENINERSIAVRQLSHSPNRGSGKSDENCK